MHYISGIRAGALALILLPSVGFAETDCTLIGNDVAAFLKEVVQDMRASKAPKNAVRATISVRIGHNDPDHPEVLEKWMSDGKIDSTNFYLEEMKTLLRQPFAQYDMGDGQGRETAKGLGWAFHVGAPEAPLVAPISSEILGANYGVRTFGAGTSCQMGVEVTAKWQISDPVNELRGFVNVLRDGTPEPFPQGQLRFTRLGPNNGGNEPITVPIEDGHYLTPPVLPSGHYKVELTEPADCEQELERDWIFYSGKDAVKNFDLSCDRGCLWDVSIRGNYKACSYGGRNCSNESAEVTWPRMPIAIDPEVTCEAGLPRLISGKDAPFDINALNGNVAPVVSGDVVNDKHLWINIGQVVGKGGGALPAMLKPQGMPLLVDFYAISRQRQKKGDAESDIYGEGPGGVYATHQCFLPGGMWGACVLPDLGARLLKREEVQFTVTMRDPMMGADQGAFVFTFKPVQ